MFSAFGEKIFSNIGKKIKVLATVLFILISAVCIWRGIYLIFREESKTYMRVLGLLIATAGPFLAWVSQFFLYGFGELVDNGSKSVKKSNEKGTSCFPEESVSETNELLHFFEDEETEESEEEEDEADEDAEFFDPTKEN